jgi:HSP20 family protein
MALIRWKPRTRLDPFADLMGMGSDIDRLFGSMLSRNVFDAAAAADGDWAPAIDVYESDDKVVVKTELPGMSEKDIEVDILGDTLTIKGEKKNEQEQKDAHYHRLERVYGSFHRSVTLPGEVETAKARATFKGGVLEIELPKTEAAKPRQIKVNVN